MDGVAPKSINAGDNPLDPVINLQPKPMGTLGNRVVGTLGNRVDRLERPAPPDNGDFPNLIIGWLYYSITNLTSWVIYIGNTILTKLFSSAPIINKDQFISLISNDKKTVKEKMAALNAIICLASDYPELQRDVLFLLKKFNEINPALGNDLCYFVQSCKTAEDATDKANKVTFDTIVAGIAADAPAAFTLMKKAMVQYYLCPLDVNAVEKKNIL